MQTFVVENLGHLLTVASVLTAIVLGALGFRQSRRAERRNLTVALVANLSTSTELAEADFHMARLIREGRPVEAGSLDAESDAKLMALLDYYEFLATAVADGSLDRRVIVHLRGPAMARAFALCEPYIRDRRASVGPPGPYGNLETFVRALGPAAGG